jgi:hypothetical protein
MGHHKNGKREEGNLNNDRKSDAGVTYVLLFFLGCSIG